MKVISKIKHIFLKLMTDKSFSWEQVDCYKSKFAFDDS